MPEICRPKAIVPRARPDRERKTDYSSPEDGLILSFGSAALTYSGGLPLPFVSEARSLVFEHDAAAQAKFQRSNEVRA
jgi:hypothetical protein